MARLGIAVGVAVMGLGMMGGAAYLALRSTPVSVEAAAPAVDPETVVPTSSAAPRLFGLGASKSPEKPLPVAAEKQDIVVNRLITGELVGACGGTQFCRTGGQPQSN